MKGLRLFVFSVLICLPAVILISAGIWLVVANVPRAIRKEPSRIGREYRETAEELSRNPAMATGSGARVKGWRQNGKIDGLPWGYVAEGHDVRVWRVDAAGRCHWVIRPAIKQFPYALVFYWGGGLAALLLIGLSALAVVFFIRFMRERDDFLAATAHDLTTPLVGMRRMIGRDDEEARRLNERMILIVENIKNFLNLGGRRKEPDMHECDIIAACREAYSLFAADYEDADSGPVSFVTSSLGDDSATLPVMADECMLLQILWNLFGNDLKYAAPYGKVEVRFSKHADVAIVEFVDEGPGMTAKQRRKAFDRYYRAKTVMVSGKGGFGIGLCASREFAIAMGGDLTVCANKPKGCMFRLTLRRTTVKTALGVRKECEVR